MVDACRCHAADGAGTVAAVVPSPRPRSPEMVTRLYFRVQLYSIVCDSDWSVPHVHTVCVHLHMPVIIKYRSLQYSCSSMRCRGSAHYSKFGVSRSAHVRSGQHPALRGVAATGGKLESLGWRINPCHRVVLSADQTAVCRKRCQPPAPLFNIADRQVIYR